MSSVSKLVAVTAEAMRVDESTVSQYSRQLINAGLLPKSRGRFIARVTPRDAIRLIMAVGLNGRFNATAEKVTEYINLRHDGVPQSAPDEISETVEDNLYFTLMLVIAPETYLPKSFVGQRHAHRASRYEFIINWPQVIVHSPSGEVVEAFKKAGTLPGHFEAPTYTSFTLCSQLFDAFADFEFGLTEDDWAKFFLEADK